MPPPFDLLPFLLQGLGITVVLTLGGAALGLVAAFGAGLARRSDDVVVQGLARTYISVFRGTSALVQLFWVYFGLPVFGIEVDAMVAGVVVLGLNTGAYGAEVVRGALAAVPRAQWEAGRVLGLTERQVLWRVVIPQALPPMLPPLGNLLIELLKNTALVSMITLGDLTFRGQVLRASTLRTAEIYALLLGLYFAIAWVLDRVVGGLERRVGRWRERSHV